MQCGCAGPAYYDRSSRRRMRCRQSGELLDHLRGEDRGHAVDVAIRVELDDVGACDGRLEAEQQVGHLARGEAAGLEMRDAGRAGRVEAVHVDADVEWALKGGRPAWLEMP